MLDIWQYCAAYDCAETELIQMFDKRHRLSVAGFCTIRRTQPLIQPQIKKIPSWKLLLFRGKPRLSCSMQWGLQSWGYRSQCNKHPRVSTDSFRGQFSGTRLELIGSLCEDDCPWCVVTMVVDVVDFATFRVRFRAGDQVTESWWILAWWC